MESSIRGSLSSTSISEAGQVQDVAYDHANTSMATVSADDTVTVWEKKVDEANWTIKLQWKTGAGAPLTKVTWAAPQHGSALAISSSRGEVSIWEVKGSAPQLSQNAQPLRKGFVRNLGQTTDLQFAPWQHGLKLAVALQNSVKILCPSPAQRNTWQVENEVPLPEACLAVSWRPHAAGLPPLILLGLQSSSQIWMYEARYMQWRRVHSQGMSQPVTSVAWVGSQGRKYEMLAIASQKTVLVYSVSGQADALLVKELARLSHPEPVFKVGWHPMGTWLAASTNSSEVYLWRANLLGEWKLANKIIGTPDMLMEQ